MRKRLITSFSILLLFFLFPVEGQSGGASSPRQFVNKLIGEVRQFIKAGDVQKANLLFAFYFDMPRFGKLCLVDHWDEFSSSERDRYINLLDQNIRQNLQKRMLFTKQDANFKLSINKITMRDDGLVFVENTLHISRGDFKLAFMLVRSSGSYRIVDYEFEGALLSRNYRGHFNYLLRKYDKETFLGKLAEKLYTAERPVAQK